jgi:hypothetical protein
MRQAACQNDEKLVGTFRRFPFGPGERSRPSDTRYHDVVRLAA